VAVARAADPAGAPAGPLADVPGARRGTGVRRGRLVRPWAGVVVARGQACRGEDKAGDLPGVSRLLVPAASPLPPVPLAGPVGGTGPVPVADGAGAGEVAAGAGDAGPTFNRTARRAGLEVGPCGRGWRFGLVGRGWRSGLWSGLAVGRRGGRGR